VIDYSYPFNVYFPMLISQIIKHDCQCDYVNSELERMWECSQPNLIKFQPTLTLFTNLHSEYMQTS